jgi:hypothetical protein
MSLATSSIAEERAPRTVRSDRLQLSPNPARRTCVARLAEPGVARLDLLDASGRALRSYAAPGPRLSIDLSGLRPGVYHCQAGAAVERLLVVR